MHDDIDRFLAELESDRGFSANTIAAYRNDLSQFVVFMQSTYGTQSWRELTEEHLGGYQLHLRERGYANSTVARKTAAVRSFCGYLLDQEILRADPSAGLPSPRVEKSVPRAMSREEVELLLAQPAQSGGAESLRDQAMLELLYASGLRVTELVSLNVDDVDLNLNAIRCTGRQGKNRNIAVTEPVASTLEQYLEVARPVIRKNDAEDALFLNHRGQRLTRQGFWLILKGYAADAGIDDITPHTLRHSFAAHQLMDGKELSEVQHALGHVSISTTQVYDQIASQMKNGAVGSGSTDRTRVGVS